MTLPIPPEELRVWVGPFSDADLFTESGKEMVRSIIALCGLKADARVLEVGCGCGRIAAALGTYLSDKGRYDGFDVAAPLINWCRQELQPQLPQFRFHLADAVHAAGHNPAGHESAAGLEFPYPDNTFELAILASVLTHILPDAIENYVRQTARVLASGGSAFMSVFLFDRAAEIAVRSGTTVFDFRHKIGSCLTFDPNHPEEGIACEESWFLQTIERAGFCVDAIERGNWRAIRSYQIRQDYVVAKKT
jgi:ubiquinone/menaquinone biosynthesis C-methylase UbiE